MVKKLVVLTQELIDGITHHQEADDHRAWSAALRDLIAFALYEKYGIEVEAVSKWGGSREGSGRPKEKPQAGQDG